MINVNELRRGNIIYNLQNEYDKRQVVVTGITSIMIACKEIVADHKFFEPIELTEEWILKAGFINTLEPTYFEYKNKDFLISMDNGIVDLCVGEYVENASKLKHLKYIHQLQNLFFSLCGEELVFSSTEP